MSGPSASVTTLDGEWSVSIRTLDGEWSVSVTTLDGEWSVSIRTLDGEWSASVTTLDGEWPVSVTTLDGERSVCVCNASAASRPCWSQSRFGRLGGQNKFLLLPAIDPRFLRHPARSLVTIPTELPQPSHTLTFNVNPQDINSINIRLVIPEITHTEGHKTTLCVCL